MLNFDFELKQGDTFKKIFNYYETESENDPVDLTEYTARMQIRDTVESEDVIVELSTDNGSITLGVGTIQLYLPADTTADLVFSAENLQGVYDLELVNEDGEVETLLYGTVWFKKEVTRD